MSLYSITVYEISTIVEVISSIVLYNENSVD